MEHVGFESFLKFGMFSYEKSRSAELKSIGGVRGLISCRRVDAGILKMKNSVFEQLQKVGVDRSKPKQSGLSDIKIESSWDKQTDRQTDKQTDRQTERLTDRQRD